MTGRILFIPPWWIPDVDLVRQFPAGRRLLLDIRAAGEIDYFRWPMLDREPASVTWQACVDALAGAVRPEHHVVEPGASSSVALAALNKSARPRSLVTVGLSSPSPATLYALNLDSQAKAIEAVLPIIWAPGGMANFLRTFMQGAAEEDVSRLAAAVDSQIPASFRYSFLQEVSKLNLLSAIKPNTIPALCLASPVPFAMAQEMARVFETLLPNADYGVVELFPIKLHEEAAGAELAEKVVTFVRKVEGVGAAGS